MIKLKYETFGMTPVWGSDFPEVVRQTLNQKYQAFFDNEEFTVEATANADQVQVCVTLQKTDKSIAYPVEAVHVYEESNERTAAEAAELMLDYLDLYWNEYLTDGRDVFVNMDWTKHGFEGFEFFVRGSMRNLAVEEFADQLLSAHGHGDLEIEPISSET